MGLPEPPDNSSQENLSLDNQHTVISTDSDSEEEGAHSGYELLQMGADFEENRNSESEDEENNDQASELHDSNRDPSLPPLIPIETTLVREVWSNDRTRRNDIEMDSAKVNEVLEAMSNFNLPANAIPEWAVNIPEDVFAKTVLEKINQSKV